MFAYPQGGGGDPDVPNGTMDGLMRMVYLSMRGWSLYGLDAKPTYKAQKPRFCWGFLFG